MVGATPFWLAAAVGDVSVMRVLAASGADPLLATKENVTPLMVAAGVGRRVAGHMDRTAEEERSALEAVKLAVELGADVNAANETGLTALHGAAYTGANTIIQFLVDKGAKIDAMDKFAQTPLSITQKIHTVALGDNFDMQPRRVYPSTVNLFLQLGATPLTALGVKVLEVVSQ